MKLSVPDGGTVLFIGDSITDALRNRDDPDSLGLGYVAMTRDLYVAQGGAAATRFLNRGIAGDRVADLRVRWKEDCLTHSADLVCVQVGINDVWHRYVYNDPTSDQEFERDYRDLLLSAESHGAKLTIIEPFMIPVTESLLPLREDLDSKISIVRMLASTFQATLIAADAIMTRASSTGTTPYTWTQDGIHPTNAGNALLAHTWFQATAQT